jgi:hypothetical protein
VGRNNAGEITSFKREEKVHNRLSPKCIKRCRRYRSADTDGQTWLTRNVIFQLESHIEGILQFKSRDPSQSALLLSSDSQTVCMACRCPDVCSKLLTLVEVAVFAWEYSRVFPSRSYLSSMAFCLHHILCRRLNDVLSLPFSI